MRNPGSDNSDLEKRALDDEFSRRFGQRVQPALLMIFPILLLAGLTHAEFGTTSLLAVAMTASTFVVLLVWTMARARAQSVESMRSEGLVADDYKPPAL